jgi:transcriptional regulator with PAS, ATPase and Fis domain
MVRLNCAAIPEALFESELFGHRKGAFTGAERDREGLIAQAEGGTLFLDEIGELPLSLQAKLLRVLQDKQYRRVGENTPRSADFRLISATNRDLRELDRESRLRSDLYYRIAVIQLELPPLRERADDFEPLCLAFARGLDPEHTPVFTERCQERLRAYPFPGNVRELRNAIEHAIVLADGAPLDVEHLPVALQEFVPPACAQAAGPSSSLERIEIESILRALARTGGNQTEAAALLGTTRRTLGYRIQKYGLAQQIAEQTAPRTLAKVRPVTREAARWRTQGE